MSSGELERRVRRPGSAPRMATLPAERPRPQSGGGGGGGGAGSISRTRATPISSRSSTSSLGSAQRTFLTSIPEPRSSVSSAAMAPATRGATAGDASAGPSSPVSLAVRADFPRSQSVPPLSDPEFQRESARVDGVLTERNRTRQDLTELSADVWKLRRQLEAVQDRELLESVVAFEASAPAAAAAAAAAAAPPPRTPLSQMDGTRVGSVASAIAAAGTAGTALAPPATPHSLRTGQTSAHSQHTRRTSGTAASTASFRSRLTAAEEERVEQLLSLDWDPEADATPFALPEHEAARLAEIDRQLAQILPPEQLEVAGAAGAEAAMSDRMAAAAGAVPGTPSSALHSQRTVRSQRAERPGQHGYRDYLQEQRAERERLAREAMLSRIDSALVALYTTKASPEEIRALVEQCRALQMAEQVQHEDEGQLQPERLPPEQPQRPA